MNPYLKGHPKHACPKCGKPNYLPNESLPLNAGARLGVNLHMGIHLPVYWKAKGGPGMADVPVHRFCVDCGLELLSILQHYGFVRPSTVPADLRVSEPPEGSLGSQD